MGEELDAKVIVETQAALGKFIKKPPLNEKLLRKPPFKFLHDVITSVINNTGFMKDLFTPDELNSENIKDRDSKIIFLQKAVDYVVAVTNEPLKIRPSKTVAGQEADKTNQFLQALAKAIELRSQNGRSADSQSDKKSRSSSQSRKNEAKEKVDNKKSEISSQKSKSRSGTEELKASSRSDKTKSDKSKVNGEVKKSSEKKKEQTKISKDVKERSSKEKESKRSGDSKEREKSKKLQPKVEENDIKSAIKSSRESRSSKVSSSRRQSISNRAPNEEKKQISPKKSPEKKLSNGHVYDEKSSAVDDVKDVSEALNGEEKQVEKAEEEQQSKKEENGRAVTGKLARSDTMTLIDPTVDSAVINDKEDVAAQPRPSTSTIRKASARPTTARPAAPRVRVVDTAPEEIQSPQASKAVNSIILDGEVTKDDDENDANFEEIPIDKGEALPSVNDLETKPHGSLVTQILETKKDLESGSRIHNSAYKQESKTVWSESARKKERDLVSREMEKVREGIQKVARSANPLGKLVGYLQEDVDVMAREIELWKQESTKLETELRREESKSDPELERLQNQLQELEEAIEAQLSDVFSAKSRILRNNERINQMITISV